MFSFKTDSAVEEKPSTTDTSKCYECGSDNLVEEDGHKICTKCGTDLGAILQGDDTSIFFEQKSGNTHRLSSGVNHLLQKSSLGTSIGFGKYRFRNIVRYHQYNSMPYKERSQWRIFKVIQGTCNKANLPPSISNEAQRFYKKISENCQARGNHRKGIIASCVYYACKYASVPRTCKEIADMFEIKTPDLKKSMKKFRELIDNPKDSTNLSTALDYIPRFCSQLEYTQDEQNIVECMIAKIYILGYLPECTSISLAATVLYLTAPIFKRDESKIKTQICKVCQVSDVTVLKCYRKIHQKLDEILPNDIRCS